MQSKMDLSHGSQVKQSSFCCAICFKSTEDVYNRGTQVLQSESDRLLKNCRNYLEPTICFESTELRTQLSFCAHCTDFEQNITNLNDKLVTIQKEILDLRFGFARGVQQRRSELNQEMNTNASNTNRDSIIMQTMELNASTIDETTQKMGESPPSQITARAAIPNPIVEKENTSGSVFRAEGQNDLDCGDDYDFLIHRNHQEDETSDIEIEDIKCRSLNLSLNCPSLERLIREIKFEDFSDVEVLDDTAEMNIVAQPTVADAGMSTQEDISMNSNLSEEDAHANIPVENDDSSETESFGRSKKSRTEWSIASLMSTVKDPIIQLERCDKNARLDLNQSASETAGNSFQNLPESASGRMNTRNSDFWNDQPCTSSRILRSRNTINYDEDSFPCPYCQKRFTLEWDMLVHKSKHENLRNKYKCLVCDQIYSKPEKLKSHESICHRNFSRQYQCEICEKSFSTLKSLKSHELLHTEAKVYKCPFCDELFFRKGELRKHEAVHAAEGIKFLDCVRCGEIYIEEEDLNNAC